MMGLWADGWFYISSAGLLVSGILFFFLLGQYRIASEAADVTEGEQGVEKEAPSPVAIRPVYIPDEPAAAQIASHAAAPEPKVEPKPRSEGDYPGPERRKDPSVTTGGISPAVVYLQNIKVELADLHKDLRTLAKRVDDELSAVSTRDDALIERLGEIARAVETLKAAAPAAAAQEEAVAAPAPKRSRKAEKASEPAPAVEVVLEAAPAPEPVVEPAPAPKAEPVMSSNETIRMELGALVSPSVPPEPAAPAAEPAEPAPAAAEPPPEEKPRRGPVWPV